MRFRMLLPASVLAVMLLDLGDPVFAEKTGSAELDRITYAVDGAESSHGKNAAMWRPNLAGPQGPMQVGEKAALDVNGGDRFEPRYRSYLSVSALSPVWQLVRCGYRLQLGHG